MTWALNTDITLADEIADSSIGAIVQVEGPDTQPQRYGPAPW